jgi:hypothetical protein
MPLEQAINGGRAIKGGFAIVAKEPFYRGSDAKYVKVNEDFSIPKESLLGGYVYFLGDYDLSAFLKDCELKVMSKETEAEYVIYNAIHDAPPYWFYDLMDKA